VIPPIGLDWQSHHRRRPHNTTSLTFLSTTTTEETDFAKMSFTGAYKLIKSENFEEYMKAIGKFMVILVSLDVGERIESR